VLNKNQYMNLYEKIEEIRAKPEHVRVRYVWAMVAISMLFVLLIWAFSIGSQSGTKSQPASLNNLGSQSLSDQLQKQDNLVNNATSAPQNATQDSNSSSENQGQ
jgi:hypothetical protein